MRKKKKKKNMHNFICAELDAETTTDYKMIVVVDQMRVWLKPLPHAFSGFTSLRNQAHHFNSSRRKTVQHLTPHPKVMFWKSAMQWLHNLNLPAKDLTQISVQASQMKKIKESILRQFDLYGYWIEWLFFWLLHQADWLSGTSAHHSKLQKWTLLR